MNKCHKAAILLAAGESKRLGYPKQLLKLEGSTLLERGIQLALDCECDPVVVVIGFEHERLRTAAKRFLNNERVHWVYNQQWSLGMGASIAIGARYLIERAVSVEYSFLLLCDQPSVKQAHLRALEQMYAERGQGIVLSAYDAAVNGPPALFASTYLAELGQLTGDSGARSVVEKNKHNLATISFPQGRWDIDSIEAIQLFEQAVGVRFEKY